MRTLVTALGMAALGFSAPAGATSFWCSLGMEAPGFKWEVSEQEIKRMRAALKREDLEGLLTDADNGIWRTFRNQALDDMTLRPEDFSQIAFDRGVRGEFKILASAIASLEDDDMNTNAPLLTAPQAHFIGSGLTQFLDKLFGGVHTHTWFEGQTLGLKPEPNTGEFDGHLRDIRASWGVTQNHPETVRLTLVPRLKRFQEHALAVYTRRNALLIRFRDEVVRQVLGAEAEPLLRAEPLTLRYLRSPTP